MQGLLARARQRGAAALDQVAYRVHNGIDSESSDAGARVASSAHNACGSNNPALSAALRSVTHSTTATVPRETLRMVERMADMNEDALAMVLRHIEENVQAPYHEWRKIHGALKLLEHLMRSSKETPLIGKMWFEVKILSRLEALAEFTHDEDTRVALLITRTATAVRLAADRTIMKDGDSPASSPRVDSDCHHTAGSDRGVGHGIVEQGLQGSEGNRSVHADAPSTSFQVIGRLLADREPPDLEGTNETADGIADDCERAMQVIAGRRRALEALERPAVSTPSSTATSGGSRAESPPRRCCQCFWRSPVRTSSGQHPPIAHPSEVASLIK